MMERKSFSYTLFIGALCILGVMVFSPQNIFAQEEIPSPAILPDSPFYGLKLAIETLQENFTFQDEQRAELILKHSEERDLEALALEKQGKQIPLEKLKAIQAEKIKKAEIIIMKLESRQNIIDQHQKELEQRKELAKASNEEERIAIQMQQKADEREKSSNLIEKKSEMGLLEPETPRTAEKIIRILPVEAIDEADDQKAILTKLRDRLENSFASSEITEVRAKFAEIRAEDDPVIKERLANQLDEQVNNPVVSIACLGTVKTLSLSLATDPVKELQKQCPVLRAFDTEMVRKVVNSGY